MDRPLIAGLRQAGLLNKSIATGVMVAFVMLILQPTALAVQAEAERQARQAEAPASAEARLAETLIGLEQRLSDLTPSSDPVLSPAPPQGEAGEGLVGPVQTVTGNGTQAPPSAAELEALGEQLQALDREVMANFEAVEQRLQARHVAETILQRHRQRVEHYRAEFQILLETLQQAEAAEEIEARLGHLQEVLTRLQNQQLQPVRAPFDPEQLPHRSLRPPQDHTPRTQPQQFRQAGLFDTPFVQLAALGDFSFDTLAGAADPAYRGESDEVVLTQAIRDQAAALEHDPVKIYHWVRNQVVWLPTWGAMQDAQLTLETRRGNALDIATLTIALLRASGIPARYAHGTIRLDEAHFRNWAGGFEDLNRAGDFVASGGIPVTSLMQGGQVRAVEMEHIWVEAAVDYFPSRGAINRTADAWVALDPSYKQYQYQDGLDALAIAGLDPEALAQRFVASGTVNEAEGWVAHLDPQILQQAQSETQAALEAHLEANFTDPTVADVLGGRRTIVQDYPVLPSGLPYELVTTGARYAALPRALQVRVEFALASDLFGQPAGGQSFAWAKLNNRQVTLSFRPASEADQQALEALLPEGEITDPDQLPDSLPAYLVEVIPELKVDGEVVLAGNAMNLGHDLNFAFSLTQPGRSSEHYRSPVVAGAYQSIAVIGGSVSPARLQALQQNLEATRDTLQQADPQRLALLTREDLLGDLFHAGTLGYFAQYLGLGRIAAQSQERHLLLAPSLGTYGYEPRVSYFFGFPRSIEAGGVVMDLDRVATVTDPGPSRDSYRQFVIQLGSLSSALEHAVPEQMFTSPEAPRDAVSAVKALSIAQAQGQRVYHLTQANQASLAHLRHDRGTMNEIRAALAVGKEVITHTDPIEVPGWRGAGYVILDPETGAGAWKIGGGANGGFLKDKALFLAGWWKSFEAKHPIIAATLSKTIGYVIASLILMIDLLLTCESIGFALAMVAVLMIYNVMTTALNIILVASGAGMPILMFFMVAEFYVENQIKNYIKESPLCSK